MTARASCAIAVLVLLALAGCDRLQHETATSGFTNAAATPVAVLDNAIDNPGTAQPSEILEGKRLFTQMNCAGCHGYDLKGGTMAPDLTDRYWRYGGTPAQIYASIANGRPKGMPTWRIALPPAAIWQLVSYIQAQGGATPAAEYKAGEQGDLAGQQVSPPAGSGSGANPASAQSVEP